MLKWPIHWGLKNRPLTALTTPQLPRVLCISPTARRYARCIVQYSLIGFVTMILILWLGAEYEDYHIRKAKSTIRFYEQKTVCAIVRTTTKTSLLNDRESDLDRQKDSSSSSSLIDEVTVMNITSFASVAAAHNLSSTSLPASSAERSTGTNNAATDTLTTTTTTTNVTIAHCGDCGKCSTPHDVAIYDATKNSLLDRTIVCAKRGLIGGRKTATKCMNEAAGFTDGCTDCWVDNILCDLRMCVFTCIWYGMFNQVNTAQDESARTLNKCTACDELRCGPAFVQCAGVNRRRAGILSDIERDTDNEVCHDADAGWWNDPAINAAWSEEQHPSSATSAALTAEDEQEMEAWQLPGIRRRNHALR